MKMRLLSPREDDDAFWIEWREGKIVFSINVETNGDAGWFYLDYTEPDFTKHKNYYGDIDKETLRRLYLALQVIFQ